MPYFLTHPTRLVFGDTVVLPGEILPPEAEAAIPLGRINAMIARRTIGRVGPDGAPSHTVDPAEIRSAESGTSELDGPDEGGEQTEPGESSEGGTEQLEGGPADNDGTGTTRPWAAAPPQPPGTRASRRP